MNTVAARHMFWQAPRAPMLTNGPFRTVPLRMSGRHVLTGGIFLSQAPGNRLDGVSVQAIIGRIQINPTIQAFIDSVKNPKPYDPNAQQNFLQQAQDQQFRDKPLPKFPPMTDVEGQILAEIAQNPSDEELKDLATIDNVFNQQFENTQSPFNQGGHDGYVTTMDVCYLVNQFSQQQGQGMGLRAWGSEGYGIQVGGVRGSSAGMRWNLMDPGLPRLMVYLTPPQDPFANMYGRQPAAPTVDTSFEGDKFYCTDTKSLGLDLPLSTMFAIDPKKTWGEIKQAVENALIIVDVHSKYPFPPPVDTRPELFWKYAAADLPKTANVPGRVDPEVIQYWMTLSTMQNYDAMSTQIQQEAAAAAAAARRRGWLMTIIGAIISVVAPFLLPLVIVSAITAIKTIITTVIDANQRKAAARALADTSKMFAKDAPAFSAQLMKTADMMDSATAQEQAAAPLTPDQQSIIQGIAQTTPSSTPVGTYVAGGVVGAGAIAALIALLR